MPKLNKVTGWPKVGGEWTAVTVAGQTLPSNVVLCCPWCQKSIHLEGAFHHRRAEKHEITFHPDGTFSVKDSVRCLYGMCKWRAAIDHCDYTEVPDEAQPATGS